MSSLDPLNPTNPNAYQAPNYNPAAQQKKKISNTGIENVQDENPVDEGNDDPTQWIDDALNKNQPVDTSAQSTNPVTRQRRFNNGLNKA